ncbi:hypothetical protein [Bacillus atrophaeus]|uniref:hypothetical protein n=1 Tax=Bacillus atrophaeus TaxID=1452 RepID=UPI002E1C105A|nr:hypothetical protein [Bacillus atrophaeus]
MFIVMGNDRAEVAFAYLSDDGQSVSGFLEDGSRVVLLEGVNFDNVWLENDQGEHIEFQQKPNSEQEISDLKQQIKELTEMVQQMKAVDS